jgi:two-component system sensor histidine kinase DesK
MAELDPSIKLTYYLLIGIFTLFILFIIVFVIIYKSKQTALFNENRMQEALLEKQKLEAEIERIKALDAERDRISMDMHDDLGSGLSSIKLISELLKRKHTETETQNDLNQIVEYATDLTSTMREMVWSLNPRNDNFSNFITYIQQYTKHFFEPSIILCTIDIPKHIPEKSMSGFVRRNIFLCYKEVLNNIIKHSKAKNVHILVSLSEQVFDIQVQDDGIGLPIPLRENNGMYTMQKRMKDCQGNIHFENKHPGLLVRIQMTLC